MGCDIHAYIEYADFKKKDGGWYTSQFAQISLGRDYTLFTLMAGVRYDPRIERNLKPLFEPRGLPDEVGFMTSSNYTLYVSDDGYDGEGFCTREQAEKWVAQGISKWWRDDRKTVTHPDWHSASWLTVDELEQVRDTYEKIELAESSWFQFNPPEKQPVPENATVKTLPRRFGGGNEYYVQVGELKTYPAPSTLRATIAAMRELDRQEEGGRSRLVFWFDN